MPAFRPRFVIHLLLLTLCMAWVTAPLATQTHHLAQQTGIEMTDADQLPCHEDGDKQTADQGGAPLPCCPEGECADALCLMSLVAIAGDLDLRPHTMHRRTPDGRYAGRAHRPPAALPGLRPPIG